MTTRWCQKLRTLSVAFVVLAIILISLAVAAFLGAFSTHHSEPPHSKPNSLQHNEHKAGGGSRNSSNNISMDYHQSWLIDGQNSIASSSPAWTNVEDVGQGHQQQQQKNGVNITKTPHLHGLTNYEFVKPTKILLESLHADDLLYESKIYGSGGLSAGNQSRVPQEFVTGHFRNKSSRIWDPHPQYEIDGFGLHLHLILYHDRDFVPQDIKITHVWPNETLRRHGDQEYRQLQGCFYKGHVRGDEKSVVAVSLCGGMQGHIRTSLGSFFIEPIEEYKNENTTILHAFYRLPTPEHKSSGDNNHNATDDEPTSSCAIEETLVDGETAATQDEAAKDPLYSTTDESTHLRRKRNAPPPKTEYTIEVLLAVDKKMQDYHGDNLQSYVLTLMSIVSSIYADESIRNIIKIAVVHILYVQHDLVLNATSGNGVSASGMLLEFCKMKKSYSFRHDTALLLTREQICRSANQLKCDTLGLAELGTMCKPTSCAIVQDNGLSAAFTIAHELGHVLNMPHDDDNKCQKFRGSEQSKENIMSRMLDHNTHPWSWSNCSSHFVSEYLKHKHGECLLDKPKRDMIEPSSANSILAGEKFTDDQQCELVFGPSSKICTYMPACQRLWCSEGDQEHEGCRTQHMPWADGTQCGKNQWCQKGACVERNRTTIHPINGNWGPWRFSDCSRTCGGGIHSATRACDSPAPANGGKNCVGARMKYQTCNTQDCPEGTMDFREAQCSMSNYNNFGNEKLPENVTWVPKYGAAPKEECMLYCRQAQTNNYFLLRDKVIDGTSCYPGDFKKCLNGKCLPAGCDNVLYSTAKLDKCGVCKGRNETCLDISGVIRHAEIYMHNRPYISNEILIPKGATNIEILQPGFKNDQNYISLKDDTGAYILNVMSQIRYEQKTLHYAGVTLEYNGGNSPIERINSTFSRRLGRNLYVQILSLQRMDILEGNIISYSYSISKNEQRAVYHTTPKVIGRSLNLAPQWKMSEWSDCDQLCNGKRFRTAACVEIEAGLKISPSYCRTSAKPMDEYESCNRDCHLSWELSRSECSNPCGKGVRAIRFNCVQKMSNDVSKIVDSSYCPTEKTQLSYEDCFGSCTEASWSYSEWTPCSKSCGGGLQNRTAICISNPTMSGHHIPEKYCKGDEREVTIRECNEDTCPEWQYGENTPCSVTCGEGIRKTVIYCKLNDVVVSSALCKYKTRPVPVISNCSMMPCEQQMIDYIDGNPHTHKTRQNEVYTMHVPMAYTWRTGRWGECSVKCKETGGVRSRTVRCANATSVEHDLVDDMYCDPHTQPISVTSCNNFRCPQWNFGKWGECNSECKHERQVLCQDHRGKKSDECPKELEPVHSESCCNFKWRAIWKPCSVSCGIGVRNRERVCMRLMPKSTDNPHPIKNGKQVDVKYCANIKAPIYKTMQKPCKRHCEFRWEVSQWSKCSVGCGNGHAVRNVTCTNGKITSNVCEHKLKPIMKRQCASRSYCTWKVGKWKNCTCTGFTRRRTVCYDTLTNKVSTSCSESERPPPKLRCIPPPNCSCRSLQQNMNIRRDGEYMLNIRGHEKSIYCYNMNTEHPQEYLTLKAGTQENYSLYYNKRSQNMAICGSRASEWVDDTISYGTTRFKKIRININSLQIVEDDFQFADVNGRPQTFGSAGDCYSNSGKCPQGDFSINLDGTGFKIRPSTQWEAKGQNAAMHFVIKLEPPYHRVRARCGGYCGSCSPSKNTSLALEIS